MMEYDTYYEVRFKGYSYNTGNGDNGIYECEETFENFDKAVEFIKEIKKLISDGTRSYLENEREFVENYIIDYVTEFVGLFKVNIEVVQIEL